MERQLKVDNVTVGFNEETKETDYSVGLSPMDGSDYSYLTVKVNKEEALQYLDKVGTTVTIKVC